MIKRMGLIVLAAGLLLVGCAAKKDTPELRLAKAVELAQLDIKGGAFENALSRATTLAFTASVGALEDEMERPATDDEKERLRGILRQALSEFITPEAWIKVASTVYAKHLTAAELGEVEAFYSSPAGAKVVSLQGTFGAEMGEAAEALFAENRDRFVKRVDEAVVKAFPDIAGQRIK